MGRPSALSLTAIGFLFLWSSVSLANFEAGEEAFLAEDYQSAFREWSPLARQGDAESQNMLGYMYRWGLGVQQNFELARQWYRRSADQGVARAQNNLGLLYRYGLGVPKDYHKAFRWFLRAAEQGNGAGQNHLGLMYYKGEGVSKNLVQAYKWAMLAANQGLDPAVQALSMLEKEMTAEQIDEAKRLAREWRPKGKEAIL